MDTREAKKELFVDTMLKTFGNVTQTCQIIGIVRQTYYDWLKADEAFKARIDAIKPEDYLEAKKDYIESQLLKLVAKGNPAAIIFSAKTLCKDRGYVEKTEVDHRNIPVTWEEIKTYEADAKTNTGD